MWQLVLGAGFVILLADGAAAIWLGQVSGRRGLVVVGLLLLVAAAVLVVLYRRWMADLDEVEALRREVHREIARLRNAADEAAGRRPGD
jgi:membrane protein implicated in regulation of membrane protease activity